MQITNLLNFYDDSDPNWQLKIIAKKCLHKLLTPSYQLSADVKLKCAIFGFDIDSFLLNEKIKCLANKCFIIWEKQYINTSNFNITTGLFEHDFYTNIDQYCSKNVNDHTNVRMDLSWLLSDVPLRWYIFKHSKTWNHWYTARRYHAAIESNNDPAGWFKSQLKALYK